MQARDDNHDINTCIPSQHSPQNTLLQLCSTTDAKARLILQSIRDELNMWGVSYWVSIFLSTISGPIGHGGNALQQPSGLHLLSLAHCPARLDCLSEKYGKLPMAPIETGIENEADEALDYRLGGAHTLQMD